MEVGGELEVCWGAVQNVFSIIQMSKRSCLSYVLDIVLCGTSGTAWIQGEDRLTTEYNRIERWNACDNIDAELTNSGTFLSGLLTLSA